MNDRLPPDDEVRELLGAFALGAVDDEERARVESLVLHDLDARAELHELEHAVAWLGHASPRPSAASWAAVEQAMAAHLASGSGGDTEDAADVAAAPTEVAPVVPLAPRRAGRPPWHRIGAIAAAVALVVGGALAVEILTDSDRGATTTVAMVAPDGSVAVTARLEADGTGTIVRSSLPRATVGHEYQLWTQRRPDQPMRSAGLLGRTAEGDRIHVPRGATRMAISVEPAGGSPVPTTSPVAISQGAL
ncbi:MAG: anti-sigma factor [Acidimicrobiia bacterium]